MNTNLRLIGRDLRSSNGLTMCAVVRDEIFLISDFLNHYRSLGVERFIILDDRSQDGTRELLLAEPDVMVMESHLRFLEPISAPRKITAYLKIWNALYLWRNQLMEIAGRGRVHTMADVDEFVVLPDGMNLHDAAAACRRDLSGTILGVMLDVYPRHLHEIKEMASIKDGQWYFDALPHIRFRRSEKPKTIYGGARARLYSETEVLPAQPTRHRFRLLFRKQPVPKLNALHKPILIKWCPDNLFLTSHSTIGVHSGRYSQSVLLPLIHYKFISPIYQKINCAISERNHHNNSEDYVRMAELMKRIEDKPTGFMGRYSQPVAGWPAFERSGNAFGFNNRS